VTFTFQPAARTSTPLLLGLVGPSGGGKTYSALRLAAGIQSVVGGEIAFIDTEARRALHYANKFKFLHLDFEPPHGPDRYLEAIESAFQAGAKTIIVDSMSHEHEGAGGVLEQHEAELDRMAGQDYRKREACNFIAWAKPKAARRKLINALLQKQGNFIFCFRAKEKIKLVKQEDGKIKPGDAGWQAIAGDEFVYEMTDRFLLPPGAKGVPDMSAEAIINGVPKVTEDHYAFIQPNNPLHEQMGVSLARWAQGEEDETVVKALAEFAKVGLSREDIAAHLGHSPTASDRDAMLKFLKQARANAQKGQTRPQSTSLAEDTEL
jgi:ABC-type dipeptide/oligopeptide/nickel transport system ATPase component